MIRIPKELAELLNKTRLYDRETYADTIYRLLEKQERMDMLLNTQTQDKKFVQLVAAEVIQQSKK